MHVTDVKKKEKKNYKKVKVDVVTIITHGTMYLSHQITSLSLFLSLRLTSIIRYMLVY